MTVTADQRPQPGRPVVVQYFKYPGDIHWRHDMVYLGQDEHGVWLGGPAGTTVQRGLEPPRSWPYPFVTLVAPDRWWSLHFNGAHSKSFRIYVDVAQPAEWVGPDRVELVDLDLDVVLRHDGSVAVLDEDEFHEHIDRYSYPGWLIDQARVTAAEVVLSVERGTEPFASAGERWLRMVE
jgi:protein associated with RNAse G/E